VAGVAVVAVAAVVAVMAVVESAVAAVVSLTGRTELSRTTDGIVTVPSVVWELPPVPAFCVMTPADPGNADCGAGVWTSVDVGMAAVGVVDVEAVVDVAGVDEVGWCP
jgi:hypothetical protein